MKVQIEIEEKALKLALLQCIANQCLGTFEAGGDKQTLNEAEEFCKSNIVEINPNVVGEKSLVFQIGLAYVALLTVACEITKKEKSRKQIKINSGKSTD